MADVGRRQESAISPSVPTVDRPRGISRRKVLLGLFATGVLAAGGKLGYDTLNKDIPVVYDYYDPKSFKPQVVDTVQATPDQIKEFMNRRLPNFERPASGKNAPSIEITAPFDARTAKSITVTKVYSPNERMPDPDRYYSLYNLISIKGDDVPIYLPLLEGANKVDVKRRLGGKASMGTIVLRYHLNDGRILTGYIVPNSVEDGNWERFKPTDTVNNLPAYDPNILKNAPEETTPTMSFDLNQNPLIDLFHVSGSVTVALDFYNGSPISGQDKYFSLNTSFKADNGKLLTPPPAK